MSRWHHPVELLQKFADTRLNARVPLAPACGLVARPNMRSGGVWGARAMLVYSKSFAILLEARF